MTRFTQYPNDADPAADLWNPALLRESRQRYEPISPPETGFPSGGAALQPAEVTLILIAARRERALATRAFFRSVGNALRSLIVRRAAAPVSEGASA